ncbi:MAG: site-specific DNA-methyltransferase [Candidatus Peribacteria bacterium]|jgi:adenine-specific DNA-methyltransferase|nr:site-specific DNA-methyltransferase [Candidatus Peribacteria bacterium]
MPETSFTNSPDLIKKEITQLAQIFPQFVSEGKVDFEGLQQYLQNEKAEKERYTMNRHGKSQAKLIAREPSKATLRPHKEKSKERDTTKNLLIEGDNLEVLKLLQNGYYEKVKCIYIDPPYNKDKDFVYTDTRKDPVENYLRITGQRDDEGETSTEIETTGRKHSNWLSMMYPRLYLARKLLRDDGVIFVSIDDDEVANLRKLMDEIFGEENFLYQLSVVNKLNGNDNSS